MRPGVDLIVLGVGDFGHIDFVSLCHLVRHDKCHRVRFAVRCVVNGVFFVACCLVVFDFRLITAAYRDLRRIIGYGYIRIAVGIPCDLCKFFATCVRYGYLEIKRSSVRCDNVSNGQSRSDSALFAVAGVTAVRFAIDIVGARAVHTRCRKREFALVYAPYTFVDTSDDVRFASIVKVVNTDR